MSWPNLNICQFLFHGEVHKEHIQLQLALALLASFLGHAKDLSLAQDKFTGKNEMIQK
jgi:hypothetical protein